MQLCILGGKRPEGKESLVRNQCHLRFSPPQWICHIVWHPKWDSPQGTSQWSMVLHNSASSYQYSISIMVYFH